MLNKLKGLLADPLPPYVFEIHEGGVFGVRRDLKGREPLRTAGRELPAGALDPSPGKPNIVQPEAVDAAVRETIEELGPARRPDAALVLPDAAVRLTVLDFDALPGDHKEQGGLIRWRLKKTVPFDIERARLAYQIQKAQQGVAVLVAVAPPEIVEQYEAVLKRHGIEAGYVSPSTAAALNLLPPGPMRMFVNLAGRSLTIAAQEGETVRLCRSVELAPDVDLESRQALDEMLADVYPTMVFISDNLGSEVAQIVLAGFGPSSNEALDYFPAETGCETVLLEGPQGPVNGREAGLWGYLSAN